MADPFLGEIRLFAHASSLLPNGWAACNGQTLSIQQNTALFSLLGTTYGGNGQTTFALPNLQGRVPMHFGGNHTQGEVAGEEAHTLLESEMPSHSHVVSAANSAGNSVTPLAANLAATSNLYAPPQDLTPLNAAALSAAGGSQPHPNLQPYLVLTFAIALQGIFPPRN
jgi:microcystin-dependent protein